MQDISPILPPPQGPQLPAKATKQDKDNAATAQSFEAVFLGQMTQLMLDSVETGEFSGGHGEEVFRGVLAEKLGTAMAAHGGIGLAPQVLDQIIKLQQGSGNAE